MLLSPGVERLLFALREKSPEVVCHSERVARYAQVVGHALGLKSGQLLLLEKGALLHDLGKLVVPQSVLEKPAPLNAEEWDIMRRHPADGYRGLTGKVEEAVLETVLGHHEWFDGRGYPGQMHGEAIPLLPRIVAIVDAFDAMTTTRWPFRTPLSATDAHEEVLLCAGTQFDPVLVEVFSSEIATILEAYADMTFEARPAELATVRPPNVDMLLPLNRRL